MITRMTETIHGWLGWCPQDYRVPVRKDLSPSGVSTSTRPMDDVLQVRSDVIVDYRLTGTSPFVFIRFVVVIIGIVLLLSYIRTLYSPLMSGFLICGLVLLAALALFYETRKAYVENTTDSRVIHKILLWPVVIPKNTITSAEVRDTVPPVPQWLLAVLLIIVAPGTSAGVLFSEYMQFVSGEIAPVPFFIHLGVAACSIPFFFGIYCHSRVRSRYSSFLVITTTTRRMIAIYSTNLNTVSGTLGQV